ncbi:family 43 glycosylhydrolase [Hymenobacter koreensis]|uniref:Ricin B lectin domain-containing protein n=1 Tax=Hymenobacter koreensis TaxID=1084523 RepID=A0ABP8IX62_9BACT
MTHALLSSSFSFSRAARAWVSALCLLLGLLAARPACALQGASGSHDPSSLIKDGNKYWMFTTGDGIYAAYSTDLINWTPGPQTIFPIGTWPSWINTYVPDFAGTFWAPECFFMNGQYYLYYSCSTFGSPRSVIGLATSPTLDPTAPNYKWTDRGMVVSSTTSSNVNAIDPALLKDSDGKVYLYYGSFNGGLGVVELNPLTGLRKVANAAPTRVAGNTTSGTRDWEAPFVVKENGFYYFFVNRGACCQGSNSTYKIVVGRGTSPLGPFLDRNGMALTATNTQATAAGFSGVGTLVLGSAGRYVGPGHFGLLRDNGVPLVSMHYYDNTANGAAKLDIATLRYDAASWPIISRDWLAAGRYKITNQNSGLSWDSWGCTANAGETIAQGSWANLTCQKWDLTPLGNGFYKVANALNANRVADLAFCTNANGTTLGIWDWLNNDCQKIKVERAADGTFSLSPAAALNRVIEVPAASTTAGVQLAIWDYTGSSCQKWGIETAPNTWTGAASTSWHDAANWSAGAVPGPADNAYIPAVANRPALTSGQALANNLTIAPGSAFTLNAPATLQLGGNWTNNGAATLNGPASFTGAATQLIGGSAPASFAAFTVNKPSGTVLLNRDLAISSALTLSGGTLTTGAYTVGMGSQASISETDQSYVLGNVEATRLLGTAGVGSTFGGLGLTLTPQGSSLPGSTTVRRVTGTLPTGVRGSQGIARYFSVQAANNTNLNVDLVFSYFDHELQGIESTSLALFKAASSPTGPWINQQPVVLGAGSVSRNGLAGLGLFTLGSTQAPLPVELTAFTAALAHPGSVQLTWATAYEKNNAGFTVERSPDGNAFQPIATVAGAGESQRLRHYSLLDSQLPAHATVLYYRLRQADLDGSVSYSPVRAVPLEAAPAALLAYPNPARAAVTVRLTRSEWGAALQLLDNLGRVVHIQPAPAPGEEAQLPLKNLPAGFYVLRCGALTQRLAVE